MKLEDIKKKAAKEPHPNLEEVLKEIRELGQKYPWGTSSNLSRGLDISLVEQACDQQDIPFYHVVGHEFSTASTYSALAAYEDGR